MKSFPAILTIIASAALAFGAATYVVKNQSEQKPAQETAFERVVRSGTLRCGYEYWDGAIMRDEKTGLIYGPWADVTEALTKATGLKVEWTSEIGWGDVGAALKSGKIDAMCAGMWTSAAKAKEMAFTTPLAYQAVEAFVRTDEHRFDDGVGKISDPAVKIVVIDNDNTDFIAQQDFPQAQRVSLSALNGTDSEELMNVMTGKADVAFTVAGLWRQFDKANPDKIRRLAPDVKLRAFGLAFAVDNTDLRLLQVMNTGAQEIVNSGELDKILDKANQDWPDMYIKPLKAFP